MELCMPRYPSLGLTLQVHKKVENEYWIELLPFCIVVFSLVKNL